MQLFTQYADKSGTVYHNHCIQGIFSSIEKQKNKQQFAT